MKFLFLILMCFSLFLNAQTNNDALKRIQESSRREDIQFIVLGDSRNSGIIPFDSMGMGDSIFMEINKTIGSMDDVMFVIHTGDIGVVGLKHEYEKYLSMIELSNKPYFTLLGNHELYSDSAVVYFNEYLGESELSFDLGKFTFIFFNTCYQKIIENKSYADYIIKENTLFWMDSIFNEKRKTDNRVLLFAHVPPYIEGYYEDHCLGAEKYYPKPNIEKSNILSFMELIEYYDADAAIFGHIHHYDYFVHNNINYFISGGAGAPLRNYPRGNTIYHFLSFNLFYDSLNVDIYSPSGEKLLEPINIKFSKQEKDKSLFDFEKKIENDTIYFEFKNKLPKTVEILNIFSRKISSAKSLENQMKVGFKKTGIFKYRIKQADKVNSGLLFKFR